MLGKKLTLIISISLVLLFSAVLGVSLALNSSRSGMRVVTERKADPAAIARGGTENEKPYPVMPGDIININTDDASQLQRLPPIAFMLMLPVYQQLPEGIVLLCLVIAHHDETDNLSVAVNREREGGLLIDIGLGQGLRR